ncbi:unnamed protein product [Linum tenue]|uniref:Protein kinase domain-containing protein n=1 Tax=Linum tenue TaxID=586396 RepID=A0AAV0HQI4_9ROSI|nr:unnamed protein product [Linum tenue]
MPVKGEHAAPLQRVPPFIIDDSTSSSDEEDDTMAPRHRRTNKNNHDIVEKSLFFLLIISLHLVPSWGLTDSESLLKFKASLANAKALADWADNNVVCDGDSANWIGVICDEGLVLGLQLEKMGLGGKIDVDSLAELEELKTVSLMDNAFDGPLPDFKKLGGLRALYLSNNQFSGEIPADAFQGMTKLKKLYLSGNKFTGEIPSSLAGLSKLTNLRLEQNEFTGRLPEFTAKFEDFNASDNKLEGPIPASLANLDPSAFSGNKGLCGKPLGECTAAPAPSDAAAPTAAKAAAAAASNSKSSLLQTDGAANPTDPDDPTSHAAAATGYWKPSTASIVFVAIVGGFAVCGILAAAFILMRRRHQPPESIEAGTPGVPDIQPDDPNPRAPKKQESRVAAGGGGKKSAAAAEAVKLSFVREDRGKFELTDLLKASAEILGAGCFGSSYKAALTSGQVMVVKRFKQMNNVGREEFHEHMRRVGRLKHTNLLPLVAYYYRKEEKLLVHDFVPYGSLAVHLHSHQALGQPSLEWENRVKIIKGVARGLSYLYKELPSLISAHGHLKSNNVLLDENFEPYLTDYALIPVINQESAQELMVAYKSPEYLHHGRVTKKTDVWALGMLILEILTGRIPSTVLKQATSGGEDLAAWVRSVPEEEWPRAVVDKELAEEIVNERNEGEVVKLVRIGLGCCEADVERRFDLKEAVERIEEVKVNDDRPEDAAAAFDDDFHSSYSESTTTTTAGGGGGGGERRKPSRELSADFGGIS